MFNLGMGEITVILLLALIFLGPGKLPDLAAGLGKIIKEIRKATSDVKNEIALDDSFRKPFEELRDAVTLHPDELKRRDEVRKFHEETAKRAAEEAAQAQASEGAATEGTGATAALNEGVAHPVPPLASGPHVAAGPNDTVIQAIPHHATLEDIPTPPPEVPLPPAPPATPTGRPKGTPPVGTIARPDTLRGAKPIRTSTPPPVPPPAASAPTNGGGNPNITQILKEEDLIPTTRGKPPPPPHLPGLRPAGAPRPDAAGGPRPGVMPPLPPNPLDTKKKP